MKREIKFRAWNSDNKLIVGEHLMCYNKDGIIQIAGVSIDESNEECDEDVLIEQWTGLKDKNGVDIYEGDIIEYVQHLFNTESTVIKRKVVKWKRDKWGVYETAAGESNIEVIGNIHDNPELLGQ